MYEDNSSAALFGHICLFLALILKEFSELPPIDIFIFDLILTFCIRCVKKCISVIKLKNTRLNLDSNSYYRLKSYISFKLI